MGDFKVALLVHSSDLRRALGHHGITSLARELNNLGFEAYVVGYYSLAVLAVERTGYSDVLGKISTVAAYLAQARPLGPLTARLAPSNLARFFLKHKIDVIFSAWVYPKVAEAARMSGSRLVVWDVDSPFTLGREEWLDLFDSADLILSYSPGAIQVLREFGFDNVHYLPHFHDPYLFFPMRNTRKTCELIFVGDYVWQRSKRRGLEIIVEPLARKYRDQLVIHGRGWPDVPYASCTLKGPIDWRQLNVAYNSACICLNIHRDDQRELDLSLNPRLFDVMGAGAFMLSDYVKGMEKMFELGKDFVVSDSEEETLELAEYYLDNEEERNKIASNGYTRAMKDHTIARRARELADLMGKLL